MSNRRVLCVDDEPRILEALERSLKSHFEIATAESGDEGLQVLMTDGPFAVVMSDMRMPGMNGAAFLGRVQKLAPDATRVLLTGQADLQAAIDAVNCGGIFRFLNKPCPMDLLRGALEDSVEQNRLRLVERELLEQTLGGTLKLLNDLLVMVAPTLFAQAGRIRDCVAHMAKKLGVADGWQYEAAAQLSQIGLVAVAPELIERSLAGKPLNDFERKLMTDHPATGFRLVSQIPRLERVAAMIRDQRNPSLTEIAPVKLGAQMLRIATDLDGALGRGVSFAEALAGLSQKGNDPQLVAALKDYQPPSIQTRLRAVDVNDLKAGMVFDEDVRAKNGALIVARGQVVTPIVLERVRRIAQTVGLGDSLRVRGVG